MEFNPDFRDLFFALNAGKVEYLVVGAYAVIYHSEPRYTKDLDVLISPTPENARRALDALKRFGAPTDNLSARDLADPELVIQLGVAPNRIDILMKIKGVSFENAWGHRVAARYARYPASRASAPGAPVCRPLCQRRVPSPPASATR